MTDDVGFGASSTFGGPIPTLNLDGLAKQGARSTNFHTTAMCSPTSAAMLTGRNHHGVGTGALTDIAMGFTGSKDRKGVVKGKRVADRVDLGVGRINNKKNNDK